MRPLHVKEIILATALLTGACKPSEKTEIQQPHFKGYGSVFKIPEEIGALEEEIRMRLAQTLNCQDSILYEVKSGAFYEHKISMDGEIVLLEDEPHCVIMDTIRSCVTVCIQYKEGTMVNGFTVGGICVPPEYEYIAQGQPNLSKKIDLSKIVKERTVFLGENYF